MATPSVNPLHLTSFLLLLLLFQTLVSSSSLHQLKHLDYTLVSDPEPPKPQYSVDPPPPTRYFEVTKPIRTPETISFSYLLLQHDFGFTYGQPPVQAEYHPPPVSGAERFEKIVLEWSASCKGRQFDRIFGVWLGGVELLRSCTAEPRASGIVWSVEKDITKYYSALMKNQTLSIYLGNLIDSTYTGVYHVNVSFHFYPVYGKGKDKMNGILNGYDDKSWADLILPVSRSLPLNDGLWFEIVNSSSAQGKEVMVPRNAYRAVLEVYVSPHEKDEFWYTNVPNDYIAANNLTGFPGNGAFREVLVNLDGAVVGAVYPFTVIYTGGVNPLMWRPITGIGSFDLPTYDIEVTPFLGNMLDGKSHEISFRVTNALNVWYINANLHLWLDSKSSKTSGKLLKHESSPLAMSSKTDFNGTDGSFLVDVDRSISASGWVKSSHGKITTKWSQRFNFHNKMTMGNGADKQIVRQLIHVKENVRAKLPSSTYLKKSHKQFPLYMYSNNEDKGNGSYVAVSNLTFAFNVERVRQIGDQIFNTSVSNVQDAQGRMAVKGNLVVSGLGSTQQVYDYKHNDLCYFRNVSSWNYTVLYDEVANVCTNSEQARLGFGLGSRQSGIPTQRVLLDP
uniref:Peptide N-acetyl-beta-D-glucosaminyl asparaginase amidase A N-terminal domain-containing protein n=1 Tax=Kalanchoe fedtschenkoi TaxID=63787 RepID=A0A7N0SY27_KALFE